MGIGPAARPRTVLSANARGYPPVLQTSIHIEGAVSNQWEKGMRAPGEFPGLPACAVDGGFGGARLLLFRILLRGPFQSRPPFFGDVIADIPGLTALLGPALQGRPLLLVGVDVLHFSFPGVVDAS